MIFGDVSKFAIEWVERLEPHVPGFRYGRLGLHSKNRLLGWVTEKVTLGPELLRFGRIIRLLNSPLKRIRHESGFDSLFRNLVIFHGSLEEEELDGAVMISPWCLLDRGYYVFYAELGGEMGVLLGGSSDGTRADHCIPIKKREIVDAYILALNALAAPPR